MTKREQAEIILDVLDERAPTNINWHMKEKWLNAITAGLTAIEKAERNETPAAATAGESKE